MHVAIHFIQLAGTKPGYLKSNIKVLMCALLLTLFLIAIGAVRYLPRLLPLLRARIFNLNGHLRKLSITGSSSRL